MGRFLAAAAFAFLLVAAPVPSKAVEPPPTYGSIFEGLAAAIDGRILDVPSPPATKEDKAALRAWSAAGKAVARALAKPSPKGFTKAAARVDTILSKAFPDDAGVQALLGQLASDMVAATTADLGDLLEAVGTLPDGDLKDQLLASIGEIDAVLSGGFLDRAAAHRLCVAATKALAAVEKKYAKALLRSAGSRGVSATVGGTAYSTATVEGVIVKDAQGRPRLLSVNGIRFSGAGTVENVNATVDLLATADGIAPGTYTIAGDGTAQASYYRTSTAGLEEAVDCTSGTITIVTIDAAAGTATGTFQGSGPSLSGGDVVVAAGKFNASGLVVTTE